MMTKGNMGPLEGQVTLEDQLMKVLLNLEPQILEAIVEGDLKVDDLARKALEDQKAHKEFLRSGA